MKKQSILLTLMLVLILSVTSFAGDTHSGGCANETEFISEMLCRLVDCLFGITHP